VQAAFAQEVASLKDALENGVVQQISGLQEQMKSLAAAVGDASAERSLSEQLVEQAARWISLNDELQRQRQELIPALQASRDDMHELHSKSEQMKTRLVAELQGLESAVSASLDLFLQHSSVLQSRLRDLHASYRKIDTVVAKQHVQSMALSNSVDCLRDEIRGGIDSVRLRSGICICVRPLRSVVRRGFRTCVLVLLTAKRPLPRLWS
jgi:chromosome segregation ATPase